MSDSASKISAAKTRWKYLILIAVLSIASAVFIIRTALQPHFKPCDLALYYVSSRAWLGGDNPYDRPEALKHWIAAGGRLDIMPDEVRDIHDEPWMPIIQLPPAHLVMTPLALLPSSALVWIWYVLAFTLLLAQTAALARMANISLYETRGAILMAITLLLAPVHEAFGYAQPSGPAISLIVLCAAAASFKKDRLAGVLLGIVLAVKPQLGFALFLYYLLVGRWRLFVSCAISFFAVTATAIAQMTIHGVPWLVSWLENIALAGGPGGINSASIENSTRSYLLSLHVILYGLCSTRWLVNLLSLLITAALAAIFFWRRAHTRRVDQLLDLSIVSILTLLPVYHRFYDAGLVVIPVAWALGHLLDRPIQAWSVLGVALCFFIPAAATTRFAIWMGSNTVELSAWWWNIFVEPFRTWVLLASTWLLATRLRNPETSQVY